MKKNLTNFDLKLIAIITMTIDHIGAIIYNDIDIFFKGDVELCKWKALM